MVQDLAEVRVTSLLQCIPPVSVAHPVSHAVGTGGSFPGVKQAGHEVDHSSPSSAEGKNVSSSYYSILLHGVQRDNFTAY